MRRRSVAVVAGFILCVTVACATPPPAPQTPPVVDGLPGMHAQHIAEPVFRGEAMIYEAGKEHARTIMLVHGLGDAASRDYLEQIPWLARSYHVIAVDLPGFGNSDKTNQLYSPKNYATFLKYVAERFAHRPFTLVGHSMGAVASLRFAATYPNELTQLVIVDAPGILHRLSFAGHHLGQVSLDFLPANLDPLGRLAKLARNIMGRAENRNIDAALALQTEASRQRYLGGSPTRIAGLAMASEDFSKDLEDIHTETLLIWGRRDTVAPLRTGNLLAQLLPRAQLAIIDEAGHEPMNQTPERFRALLEPFLEHGLAQAQAAAAVPPLALAKRGVVTCVEKRQVVYEGEYERLTLRKCTDVLIRKARVHVLDMRDSSVKIEDSHIGGGAIGMTLRGATVEMTGGRLEAELGILAADSRLDIAGVTIEVKEAVMKASETSEVVFSFTRVRGPILSGIVHGVHRVEDGRAI